MKVRPDEDRMVRLVADDPAVRRLRERGGRSYLDRVRLGEAVAAAVQQRAAADAGQVLDALRPLAVRDTAGPPVEGCALNASFLVEEGRMDSFLARVAALDSALDDRCQVRAFGPMPPYSFTEPIGG